LGRAAHWSRQGGGRLLTVSWSFRGSPLFQILCASRMRAGLSASFLKHRACLPGKNGLDGVSQSSEDCSWPELDHCCSVLADKHKLERFLRPDAALVVTVYAPITFPPASVLLFKQRSNGKSVRAEEVVSGKQTLAGCSHTPLTSASIQ